MAAKKICAVGIKRLWYTDPDKITAKLTGALVATLLADAETKEVKNIHQDTWTLEESESSQDGYRNQLTGSVYRMGTKQMGDLTVNFTIGKYDYALKAEFLGGTATETSWERARGIVEVEKALIALTEDNQYCVLTKANINAREGNTDGAIGLAVVGTAMEPDNEDISSEYWFDSSAVTAAAAVKNTAQAAGK